MKKIKYSALGLLVLVGFSTISGCGYTRKSAIPENVKTIYVDTVKNTMKLNELYAYVPGLEMMITNAVINRLNIDGNLSVVQDKTQADVILESNLTGLEQGGTRFSNLEAVEEYRMFVVVAAKLINGKTKDVIWEEPNFSGDSEYFVSDIRTIARQEAAERAVKRLASNLVDRIVEDW